MQVKLHNDQLVALSERLGRRSRCDAGAAPGPFVGSLFDQQAHRSQPLRDQIAFRVRLDSEDAHRNFMSLAPAAWKDIEQKRRIETRDAVHRNMSGSFCSHPDVQEATPAGAGQAAKGCVSALEVERLQPERVGMSLGA